MTSTEKKKMNFSKLVLFIKEDFSIFGTKRDKMIINNDVISE